MLLLEQQISDKSTSPTPADRRMQIHQLFSIDRHQLPCARSLFATKERTERKRGFHCKCEGLKAKADFKREDTAEEQSRNRIRNGPQMALMDADIFQKDILLWLDSKYGGGGMKAESGNGKTEIGALTWLQRRGAE